MNGLIEIFYMYKMLITPHREEVVSCIMKEDKGMVTENYRC